MPSHPDLNTIAAFADGRLSPGDRSAFADHLTECSECRTTLSTLARGLSRPARSNRTMTWLSLAATLMLATVVGTFIWRGDRGAQSPAATTPTAPATPASTEPVAQPGLGSPGSTVVAPPPAAGSTQPAPAPSLETPALSERRGAVRRIDGKTFRLVAGEWLDSAYDPLGLLPVERVDDAQASAALLARLPALKPFAELGPRVLVVHDGVVYRFAPQP